MPLSSIGSSSCLVPAAKGANREAMPLRGRWLRLLQALWSLLVICELFVLMVSPPAFYQVLHTVCTGLIATCFISDQLLSKLQVANRTEAMHAAWTAGLEKETEKEPEPCQYTFTALSAANFQQEQIRVSPWQRAFRFP